MTTTASIVITTKNRCEELRRAVRSAIEQEGCGEVLVFDDGSTDRTAEKIRSEFPTVRLERVEESLGIVGARNKAIQAAEGEIVITIDDDCVFSSPDTVARTIADFDAPYIGAVAIPHINVYRVPVLTPSPLPFLAPYVVSEFSGGASAVRRKIFHALGGYRTTIWRQAEEYDFCTRLLSHGWVTRAGTATAIRHFESPNRDFGSIHFHKVRSHILYAWNNVPDAYLPIHMPVTIAKTIVDAARNGHFLTGLSGMRAGLSSVLKSGERRPVSRQAYKLMRHLRKRGLCPLSEIAPLLPQRTFEGVEVSAFTAA